MKTQVYANHRRYVAPYHFYSPLLFILIFIGIVTLLARPVGHYGRVLALLFLLFLILSAFNWFFLRKFAVKVQDRAIRAEENLRYFILTGKPLPSDLRPSQIVGLRFAEDAEFVELVQRASAEKLSGEAIKKLIKNWKPDHYRA